MNSLLSCHFIKKLSGVPLVWAASCAGLILSAPAQAKNCTITPAATTITFGTVTVPRNAPVGTQIGATQTSSGTWTCPANPSTNPDLPNIHGYNVGITPSRAAISLPATWVWDTGIAGIGIEVMDTTYLGPDNYNGLISRLGYTGGISYYVPFVEPALTYTSTLASGSFGFRYRLVTTAAPVAVGGPIPTIELASLGSNDRTGGGSTTMTTDVKIYLGSTTIVANGATCTVSAPASVVLPTVMASALNPAGTAAGDTAFSIALSSCPAGVNVYITLTDTNGADTTTSNLNLTADSSAQGVKLRVSNSGGPVKYGPALPDAGNTNQWLVGASASTMEIPLKVQYISTGPVTAGTVKGQMQFTMSYQ